MKNATDYTSVKILKMEIFKKLQKTAMLAKINKFNINENESILKSI